MKPAIRVENLAKSYHLGSANRGGYRTLRETITDSAAAAWHGLRGRRSDSGNGTTNGATKDSIFWALKDVSFEVQPGEVVGVIGRNGAGKSTLLKILSRITEPTKGRCEIRGRMASLLEVGTGFHPELTGRENIYMNGSLLGMRRKEIEKRFDEIVAFSEIEKFLDTPVKRYSSGMYVRLAFAVAAHLEPETLIIDEVLAVGDVEFQRKCLNKISEVSKGGKTVLFVSHNLAAVKSLCESAIVMENGKVIGHGPVGLQISTYLSRLRKATENNLSERTDREGNGQAVVTAVYPLDEFGNPVERLISGSPVQLVVEYEGRSGEKLEVALSCWTQEGVKLWHVDSTTRGRSLQLATPRGKQTCVIPGLMLAEGEYFLNVALKVDEKMADHIYFATSLKVIAGDVYQIGRATPACGGLVLVNHDWN